MPPLAGYSRSAATDEELGATVLSVLGPLTDAELRATAVAVLGPLTDAELRAADVSVTVPDAVEVQTKYAALQAAGRLLIAGTGQLTLAVAGNVRATLENPAGSGRNLLVLRFQGMATSAGWATLRVNPTSGLPVAAKAHLNSIVGLGSGVGLVKADTDTATALGGGTASSVTLGLPAGTRFLHDFTAAPLVLTPGVTLGIGAAFAGAASVGCELMWAEEDAA